MSEPFIAEVRIFAGNFAPRGWAFCNGQLLPISQNTALFSIIGTTYGGDGRTTTGLPNLQGRAPMHPGQGPGLTRRRLGETGGVSEVALIPAQMPSHNHVIQGSNQAESTGDPSGASLADTSPLQNYAPLLDQETLASDALANAGAGQAHTNSQPYLGLAFIIAMVGVFPTRA
jgi:microcystin-dependent protein